MTELTTPIRFLKGVGPKMEGKLINLGIHTVEDLILYLPRSYRDYSKIVAIKDARIGDEVTFKAIVWESRVKPTRTRRKMLEAVFSDNSGTIKAVWFNQGSWAKQLAHGAEYFVSGKVTVWRDGPFLNNPTIELASEETLHTAKIVPIYPETPGVTSKYIRKLVNEVKSIIPSINEILPIETITCHELMSYPDAIYAIHFPESDNDIKKAEHSLGFREIYFLLLARLMVKKNLLLSSSPQIIYDVPLIKDLLSKLSYKLTDDQKKAVHQILSDLKNPHPMSRLLQGDVGSGKTVVAAIAMLLVAKSKHQSVYMAPTEILSVQHYNTVSQLLNPFDVSVSLLTSTKKDTQDADILIGTHALIQKSIFVPNLALAIVDEQHRFGVNQRKRLTELNNSKIMPHMLSMTATPIPRTLALTLYGDLDISTIREMPVGRKKIDTQVIYEKNRSEAYKFMKNEIKKGRQAFVVVPLIDESDTLGVKSVKLEFEKLDKEVFPDTAIGLLHGKMKPAEKEKVMTEFKAGRYKILVSTPVVEVGIDVPNASVMVIESAQRFGLSQLHQFRGRVGRGEHQSYCFLFTETPSPEVLQRLRILERSNDGFELSEADLKMRGPGEATGVHQHGYLNLRYASIYDEALIKEARESAVKTLESSADLSKYPSLQTKITDTESLVLS